MDADPPDIARLLFNKKLEEVALKGKLKQRQRLLDLSSSKALNQASGGQSTLKETRQSV